MITGQQLLFLNYFGYTNRHGKTTQKPGRTQGLSPPRTADGRSASVDRKGCKAGRSGQGRLGASGIARCGQEADYQSQEGRTGTRLGCSNRCYGTIQWTCSGPCPLRTGSVVSIPGGRVELPNSESCGRLQAYCVCQFRQPGKPGTSALLVRWDRRDRGFSRPLPKNKTRKMRCERKPPVPLLGTGGEFTLRLSSSSG